MSNPAYPPVLSTKRSEPFCDRGQTLASARRAPLHFPLAAWASVTVWGDRLWPELIGILGWQDVPLPTWTYFLLTIILLLAPLQKLNLDGTVRARVAVITGLAVLGYVVTVYLIFSSPTRRSISTTSGASKGVTSSLFC